MIRTPLTRSDDRDDRTASERAVSPVIGVILMVAITVILAAVIGTFVLDLGQNVQNTGPSASMGFEDADEAWTNSSGTDFIVIEHQSGESLDADNIRIIVRNDSSNAIVAEFDQGSAEAGNWTLNGATFAQGDTVNVGDVIVIEGHVNNDPATGYDYGVEVVSTETDNKIATGTVEVQ